jgi:hypothetical protein
MRADLHHHRPVCSDRRVRSMLKRQLGSLFVTVGVTVVLVTAIAYANSPSSTNGARTAAAGATKQQIAGIVRGDGGVIAGSGFRVTGLRSHGLHPAHNFRAFVVSFPKGTWSPSTLPVPIVAKFRSWGQISITAINLESPLHIHPKSDGSFSFSVLLTEPQPVGRPARRHGPAFSFTVSQS